MAPRHSALGIPTAYESELAIENTVNALNLEWGLGLNLSDSPDQNSPKKREETGITKTQEFRCLFKIRFICRKTSINASREKFQTQATRLYNGWVHKPRAERGVIPDATRHNPRRVTESERKQLLDCLFDILNDEYQKALELSKNTPISSRRRQLLEFDDSAIPWSMSRGMNDPKRPREDHDGSFFSKKVKKTECGPVPDMLPPQNALRSFADVSVNTSFASTTSLSERESIFSRQDSSIFTSTQSTIADEEQPKLPTPSQEIREAFSKPQDNKTKSSDYGSSFDANLVPEVVEDLIDLGEEIPTPEKRERDPQIEGALSQDLLEIALGTEYTLTPKEVEFRDSLHQVFFDLPSWLKFVSFRAIYEITRVCLHAGVSVKDIKDFPRKEDLDDYDLLWNGLKARLKGMNLPERCAQDIWEAAADTSNQTRRETRSQRENNQYSDQPKRDVIYSGALEFTCSTSGPLFKLRLRLMKFDHSHRLSRRFGSHRFLELDIPHLSGRRVPKNLQDIGDRGPEIIQSWLVEPNYQNGSSGHPIFGRYWSPFHVKPKERKKSRDADQSEGADRLIFFAVDGPGFSKKGSKMDIAELLNCIRPTKKNGDQPFLKLFARNALALSRTTPTVVLEPNQIIPCNDLTWPREEDLKDGEEGEVMTDGAGRISPKLACKIVDKLGLSYSPSGLQGRIGKAKGFWTVDHTSERPGEWIEVYESQCKWKSGAEVAHFTNRTFEVCRWSGPLRSATLNIQFLPLLVERAKEPQLMQHTLNKLLEDGLKLELETMQKAMMDSQCFRKWLRDTNNNIDDRIKAGMVPYKAGMPVSTHERLNMLLDVGFDAQKTWMIKDMARTAFRSKCDELEERLNITVGKSAYVYMVPDFWGVLEEGEVFIEFSSFIDNESGLAGVFLNRKDILVARPPANYASDIQRARVVFKQELIGLKDVIVFSTKGNPSLAAKLSGGDYDGDFAWVCWEETIVENFEHVDVPKCPDLLKEGLIRQNKMSYDQLVKGCANPTSLFLKQSFAFNMQPSMLGICTSYKDNVVYTQGRYDTREAVYLSTLLSNLVDQAKQGYIFTGDDWVSFQTKVIRGLKVTTPFYKMEKDVKKRVYNPKKTAWVIDRLMFLAHKLTEESLGDFSSTPDPPFKDPDLLVIYNWAKDLAKKEREWAHLIEDLDADIKELTDEWKEDGMRRMRTAEMAKVRNGSFYCDDSYDDGSGAGGDYMARMEACRQQFEKVAPHTDTPFTQGLLLNCQPDRDQPDYSTWALLRASALFRTFKAAVRTPWLLAGRQLCMLKAMHGIGNGRPVVVTPAMYAMLKPDAAYVKRSRRQGVDVTGEWDEGRSVVDADEVEGLREDF